MPGPRRSILSLRWIVLSSRWSLRSPPVIEALLACRARPRHPKDAAAAARKPPYNSGPSSRDFLPPLHACLGRLICQTRCWSFRVPYSLSFVVFVVVLDMDRKRKDQLLEALFRASLVEASRLKMKGRPARKAGSASIGNKNKTHKTAVEGSRTAFAR